MKNKLFRRAAVLTAALFSLTCMSVTAYAQSDEPAEETTPPAATETVAKPFTTDGMGTVVDNATDEDGKEFFTITTPSENIFYLVIDRQRTENNVYFLNAVTEKDLMALAEADSEPEVTEPVVQPEPEPEPVVIYMVPSGSATGKRYCLSCWQSSDGCRRGAGGRWCGLLFQGLPPEA